MKKFTIHSSPREYIIVNNDEDYVFKELTLNFAADNKCIAISATFPNLKEFTSNVTKIKTLRDNFEHITEEGIGINQIFISSAFINPSKVREFISVFHKLEPLPLQVFDDLAARGINFPEFTINPLNSVENISEAIDKAIEAHQKGCPEKFIELANYYEEHDQLVNWIEVLKAIPRDHMYFKQANELLLRHYNDDDDVSLTQLANRFKAAYNAGLPEREFYFSELAGEEGLSKLLVLDQGESNPDLLIDMALIIREKNSVIKTKDKEIQKLMEKTEHQDYQPQHFKK